MTYSDGREEIFSDEEQERFEAQAARDAEKIAGLPFFRLAMAWEQLSEAEVEADVTRQLVSAGIEDGAAEAARLIASAREDEAECHADPLADWRLLLAVALKRRLEAVGRAISLPTGPSP